jgi:hypothetical protein
MRRIGEAPRGALAKRLREVNTWTAEETERAISHLENLLFDTEQGDVAAGVGSGARQCARESFTATAVPAFCQ